MRRFSLGAAAATLALATATGAALAAKEVEVLHWWTAGGEAAALNVLKEDLAAQGVGWVDMPIAGGSGVEAMTVLRARVAAGNAPVAVQLLGFDITDWAKEGALAPLDDVAEAEGWEEVVPGALKDFAKYDGHWIAAPVNVHSTNWVWANKALLDELGIAQPTTWEEFVAALEAVQAAGKVALAHGGQAWQDATIFDSAVLIAGGPEFYKKSMIDLDPEALGSETMVKAFEVMKTLRGFVDPNFSGRDWNLASAMVINGEAAFQIMGDWAKGEFLGAGKTPGEDFLCFRVPGTEGVVTFNADQFAMFKVSDPEKIEAQKAMAAAILSPPFQIAFNTVKGSVPARVDVSDADFDACGKQAMADLAAADEAGTLLGSMGHGYANPAAVKNAIYDVVTAHFNGEYDSTTAAEELVTAVEIAQ
ncbi:ABC transporter substrate-binding protein [Neomegalonema perideroedes]|uniref:ABC transporter substrate-binding protein n=1 Tax=Neomegalonema perideroedes TaxID=217219 RepID=UPI0003A57C7C|nr:ABC transporter substrate-binding protein [Neomegalonema perideroedes]